MQYTTVLFLLLLCAIPSIAQDTGTISDLITDSQNSAFKDLADSANYTERNIVMVAEDGSQIRKSQKDIDDALKVGYQYYKEENYEEAFSILSKLAAMGNKEAQGIIGMMFLQGQHVQKSTVSGMGWLGVANESTKAKNKNVRKAYKQVYSQLSSEHQKVIDQTVADYVGKYGIATQNIVCKKVRNIGSNISKSVCVKSPNSKSPLYPVL